MRFLSGHSAMYDTPPSRSSVVIDTVPLTLFLCYTFVASESHGQWSHLVEIVSLINQLWRGGKFF